MADLDRSGGAGVELWFVPLTRRVPLSEPWLAAVLFVVLSGASRLVATLDPSAEGLDARVPYTVSVAVAYVVPATRWAIGRGLADLDGLRPFWRGAPERFAEVRYGFERLSAASQAAAVAIGFAFAFAMQETLFGRVTAIIAGAVSPAGLWMTALAILLWASAFPGAVLALKNARTLREVGTHDLAIAPWDVVKGIPIAHFGLRTLGLWLVGPIVIWGVAVGFRAAAFPVVIWMFALMAIGATACLVVPTSGLRATIRREKRAELDRVDRAIAGEAGAMEHSVLGPEARALDRLRLIQWQQQLGELREWPIDAPLLRRFALFVALPIFSWVAAALVERGLDTLLSP